MKNFNFLKKLANTPPCIFRGASHVLGLVLVLLTLGVGKAWGTVKSTYTFSTSDNNSTVVNNNVSWGIGSGAVATNGTSLYLGGTISITMPTGAYLYSAKINKASNWSNASKVSVLLKSGNTTLKTFTVDNYSSALTLTSNQSDGSYTITRGNTNKNAWITSIELVYYPQTVVTLDKNEGDEAGEVKFSYGATDPATSSFKAATREGFTCNGYYTANSGGTKVLNADGSRAANVSGWWTSNKWSKDAATATLYAQWTAAGPACDVPSQVAQQNGSITSTGVTLNVTPTDKNYQVFCSTSNSPASKTGDYTTTNGSVTINNLKYGTTYYYWVRTDCGSNNYSSWFPTSNPSSFTTTCPQPTSVSAGTLTKTGATFTITDNNSPKINSFGTGYGYDIYCSTESSTPAANVTPTASTTALSASVTSLSAGTTYYYWIRGKGPNAKSSWKAGSGTSFTTLHEYTLTYKETDGTGNGSGKVVENATSFTNTTAPSKVGHTLEGFYAENTLTTKIASNANALIASKTGWTDGDGKYTKGADADLYLKWTANEYTIGGTLSNCEWSEAISSPYTYDGVTDAIERTVNPSAGYGCPASITVTMGGSNLTKGTDYTWSVTNGVGSFTLKKAITGNVVINITAQPMVTWMAGDQIFKTQVGSSGTALSNPTDPSPATYCTAGKTFVGWTATEISGSTNTEPADLFSSAEATSLTIPAGGKTYYAVFATVTGTYGKFKRVTSTSDIVSGGKVAIVNNSKILGVAYNGTTYSYPTTTAPTEDNTTAKITKPATNYIWNISKNTYWIFTNQRYSNKKIATSAVTSGTELNIGTQTYTEFELGTNSGLTNGFYLRLYNDGASTPALTTCALQYYNAWKVYSPSSSGNPTYNSSSNTALKLYVPDYTATNYATSCCTELGTINGVVSLNQLASPDPTKLKATWTMNAATGISSYNLEVYNSSDVKVKTIEGYTSGTEITNLAPCTSYYVKLYTLSSGGNFCEGGLIGTSESCTTSSYSVTFPTLTGTTKKTGDATACKSGNYVATFEAANAAYELPTTDGVTVTIDGETATEGAGNDYTWAVSEGVGTLTIPAAKQTGDITISVVSVAHTCTATPVLGTASLSGAFNLSTVGISCASITPGSYCAVESGNYGFIWYAGTGDKVIGDEGVNTIAISSGDYSTGSFAAEIGSTFVLGNTYTFRAFAENTGDKTGYSTAVSFTPQSVTFVKGNGEENVVVYVNKGGTVAAPSAPSKTGYDFNYWQKTSGAYDFSSSVEGNITLTAIWGSKSYDVTLKANGGTGDDEVVSAMYDDDMPTDGVTVHTKTGYTLLGYWDATSEGKQYYSYDAETSTLSSESLWDKTAATNLYARWQANEYTVTFDKQGGKNGYNNRTATFDAAMPALSRPSKDGYAFSGYFDATNGGGKKYYNADGSSAATWDKAENTTLYAYWIPVMTFSVNGEIDGTLTRNDNTAMPSAATVPTSCGDCWAFIGWSTDANKTSAPEYAGGATHEFGEPTTLYAVFGKSEYQLITSEEDLVANDNYVVASSTEWALSNAEHSYYSQDAASADISSISKSTASGYYIYNPSASIIWKFTGNKDAGQLYNVAAEKYINLTESKILGASQDLKFTLMADGEAWVIQYSTTNYLHGYSSNYGNGFESLTSEWWSEDSYSAYLYRQLSAVYATQPSCATYTIAWEKDGATYSEGDPTTSATQCEGIESIPDAPEDDALSSCSEKFVGWSESELYGTGNAAPADLFADLAGTPVVDGDKTFHAVFATTDPDNKQDASITTTFTSKSWEDDNSLWESGKDGYANDTKGIQVTKDGTGANATTKDSYYEVKSVVITWGTSNSATGSIDVEVGGVSMEVTEGSISGGQSDQTMTFEPTSPATTLTGNVKFTVNTTYKSIYIKSVQINYTTIGYKDYITSCCTPHAINLSGVDEEEGKVFSADKEQTCDGKTVTLSYTEDGFYTLNSWTVTKASSGTVTVDANNQFEMPNEAVTVTAAWDPKPYKLTVVEPTNGSVAITGSDASYGERDVDYKTAIQLVASPAEGYVFQNWTITPNNLGLSINDQTLNFNMPGEAVSFTANFSEIASSALTLGTSANYTLSAKLANGDEIPNTILAGTSIKVTYSLNGQNEKTGWTLSPNVAYTEGENYITFNMPGEDMTISLNTQPYYLLNVSATNGNITGVHIGEDDQEVVSQYRVHTDDEVVITAEAANNTYKFKEWTCDGATISNGSLTVGTSNITATAVYEDKIRYNVTLMALGRQYAVLADRLEGESLYSLVDEEAAPTLTNYDFLGWSLLVDDASMIVTNENDLDLDEDYMLYAVYREKRPDYYEKVTSTSGIADGQYLIVYESSETAGVAFDGSKSTLDANNNTTAVSIKNGRIAISSATEAAEFTIDKSNKYVKSSLDKYINYASWDNGLTANSDATAVHSIVISDNNLIIEGTGKSGTNYVQLKYNTSAHRFRFYKSGQEDIQLYKRTTPVPADPISVPTDVVDDGETLEIEENAVYNNLLVENGGKVTIATGKMLAVNDLTIESMAGKSGQLTGSGSVTVNGNIYLDIKFYTSENDATLATLNATEANQWYMISAPFDVNLADGFINPVTGATMHRGNDDNVNTFDLFEYDGEKRATTGTTGWKRVSGKMTAGTACLIGFNPEQPTTIRLKAASNTISNPTSITLASNESSVGETEEIRTANSNWNGVANPTFHYTDLSTDAYIWNNEEDNGENQGRKYTAYSAGSCTFVVGTPLFIQGNTSANLTTATNNQFRAPKREVNERIEYCVRITHEGANGFADQMYVRASEEATNVYELNHDLIAWNGTSGKSALLWSENYGMRLAIEEAPLANNKATYTLGIFAPNAGEYVISTPTEDEDATLYLTLNGHIIWNLSLGDYTADLQQGLNEGYGLKIVAAPKVSTGVEQPTSDSSLKGRATKVIIDEHVFILRGEQLFDVTGKTIR